MIEPDAVSDFSYFIGDLNFRLNSTYTEHAREVNRSAQMVEELDQLYLLRESEGIFPDYEEKAITFMPTYKRHTHTNEFVNKKDQCPSYTDRVLVKNNSSCAHQIMHYGAHEEFWGSDHRPVFTLMRVVTQPQQYMNPLSLLNQETPVQGYAQIKLMYCILEFHT